MRTFYPNFEIAIQQAGRDLKRYGKPVAVGHWQGLDVRNKPDMVTHELLNYSFTGIISPNLDTLREQIKPNLPWADDHFLERVGREPLNPGVEYQNWPYYVRQKANDQHRTEEGQFTHTYMERIWPPQTDGIRYPYGNLDNVVELLYREPLTRQAYLPIWYPEDTGAVHEGRVPCTLGYHFMIRESQLHIWYPIRACDYIRHFRDDIYLACRLGLWILDELKKKAEADGHQEKFWNNIRIGKLTMQIYSFHVFAAEKHML